MDVREKLVEILLDAEEKAGAKRGFSIWSQDNKLAEFVADHLIANGVTVQGWIPVTDRLPDYYFDHVLINVIGDKPFATVHEAYLRKDGLWVTGLYRYDKEDVTHWMPLPQPPKGE